MTPVEELREAARLMRERAEATARPHHPYGDPDMELVETTEQWSAEVREYLGGDMGEYCASMHPAVALALADLLDTYSEYDWSDERHRAPLAVARAFLGGAR